MSDPNPSRDPIPGLSQLSEGELPAADERFADDLDARLRALHAAQRPGAGFVRRADPRRRVAGFALVAVVGIVLLALLFVRGGPTTVELLESRNVSITLPDGSEIDPEPGLDLPPGTIVATGADGFARFEFGTVGPDERVRVFEDRFERLDDRSEDPADEDGTSASTVPAEGRSPTTTVVPADRQRPSRTTTVAGDRGQVSGERPRDTATPTPITPPRRAPVAVPPAPPGRADRGSTTTTSDRERVRPGVEQRESVGE